MRAGFLVFSLLSAVIPIGAAQPSIKRLDGSSTSPAEIDGTISRLMQAAEVTGAGITIFHSGKVAYSKAYGFRDTGKKLPLTPDSVMGAASLTKATFAYLVMQLVEQHVLELDEPVQNYLPKPLPE